MKKDFYSGVDFNNFVEVNRVEETAVIVKDGITYSAYVTIEENKITIDSIYESWDAEQNDLPCELSSELIAELNVFINQKN